MNFRRAQCRNWIMMYKQHLVCLLLVFCLVCVIATTPQKMITTWLDWEKMPQKTLFCHHKQCIFDPKRAKTAKTRFFPELLTFYFRKRPKIQFECAKLRRSLDFKILAETLNFGQNSHFLTKKGPKRVKNFDVRILNTFFSLINSK